MMSRFSLSVAVLQAVSSARVRKQPKHRPSAPMQQIPTQGLGVGISGGLASVVIGLLCVNNL